MSGSGRSEPPVSLGALFVAFLTVSLGGFGAGIALARHIAVERRGWISEEEFADIVSICQFTPGPNIIGIAVCVGSRARGPAGAVATACGFVIIPLLIGFPLGLFFVRNAHLAAVRGALGGISAVAAGLLIATGIRMMAPFRDSPRALIIAALALAGMVFTGLPLFVILICVMLLSGAGTAIEKAHRL